MADLNTHIFSWNGPFGLPQFDKIDHEDYRAAFEEALKLDRQQIDQIAGSSEAPTFENTIIALESAGGEVEAPDQAGDELTRVSSLFWNLTGTMSDDILRELERDIAPKLSRHMSQTAANKQLFARVDAIWKEKDKLDLTNEQHQVLKRRWKGYIRAGAALDDRDQE